MQQTRGFIQNIVMIAILLAVVFLSQQSYTQTFGKNWATQIEKKSGAMWQKANDWFKVNIYPKATQEAQKRGAPLTQAITQQKDMVAQTIWEKIKNYFAEKFSTIFKTKVQ